MNKEEESVLKLYDIFCLLLFIFGYALLTSWILQCNDQLKEHIEQEPVRLINFQTVSCDILDSELQIVQLEHLEDDRSPEQIKFDTYFQMATQVGEEFDLDPYLIMAVCEIESHFTPEIVGGGVGLMQLIPFCHAQTMAEFGYSNEDLFDAYKNMRIGCKYLSYLTHKYKDIPFSLVCYNKGEGGALGSGMRTSYYSDVVMQAYYRMTGGDICASSKVEENETGKTASPDPRGCRAAVY